MLVGAIVMLILSQEVLIPEERTAGVGGDFLSLKG